MKKSRLMAAICACAITLIPVYTHAILLQAYQGTGNYGLEVAAVGFGAAPSVASTTNTLNLSVFPGSATPVQAYLYAYDTNHTGGMTATFNNIPLMGGTPVVSYASDGGVSTLYTFRWDVTSLLMPGVTNYSWSFSETQDPFGQQGNYISMATLAVVYSAPSLPTSTATIIDGMTYVGNTHPETESINIAGLPAGSNKIFAATYLDDNNNPPGSTGETVTFNSSTIGGPLDKNLFLNGSLLQMTGTSGGAANTPMSISTQSDEFGWTLAATLTTVPIPPAIWLFGAGLVGLIGIARRKR
jgi:hypothetical protein